MARISDLFNPPPKAYDPYEDFLLTPGKEAFARLFQAEAYFVVPEAHYNDDAKMASRVIAVHVIDTHYPRTRHAFDPLISYMAVTFFDRYSFANADFPRVVGTSGKGTDLELFAFCCLTLSWKLRDSNFHLTMFLREKNQPFARENVFEMELAICRGLEWRLRTVTPYLFAGFLTPYLDLRKAESEIHHLILASQREVGYGSLGKRPSVIAASALLAVANGMVSADHGIFLLVSVIREVQPLIPLEDEIVVCTGQMGLLYKPPVDDTPLPPRRRRSPPPSPPRGQTSSGSGAPSGTGEPSSGQCKGKEPVVDPDDILDEIIDVHVVDSDDEDEIIDDPVHNLVPRTRRVTAGVGTSSTSQTTTDQQTTDDVLDEIIDVHVVDSDDEDDEDDVDDEEEIIDDPVYDLVPRTRRVTAGVGTSSTSQTTGDQKKASEGTSTSQTTDQQTTQQDVVPPIDEQDGSGGTRKQPTCCNIQ